MATFWANFFYRHFFFIFTLCSRFQNRDLMQISLHFWLCDCFNYLFPKFSQILCIFWPLCFHQNKLLSGVTIRLKYRRRLMLEGKCRLTRVKPRGNTLAALVSDWLPSFTNPFVDLWRSLIVPVVSSLLPDFNSSKCRSAPATFPTKMPMSAPSSCPTENGCGCLRWSVSGPRASSKCASRTTCTSWTGLRRRIARLVLSSN